MYYFILYYLRIKYYNIEPDYVFLQIWIWFMQPTFLIVGRFCIKIKTTDFF